QSLENFQRLQLSGITRSNIFVLPLKNKIDCFGRVDAFCSGNHYGLAMTKTPGESEVYNESLVQKLKTNSTTTALFNQWKTSSILRYRNTSMKVVLKQDRYKH
ncbi:MAG: hypothetical protein ACXWWD_12230, partial [Chitinophagaceae bacterium]